MKFNKRLKELIHTHELLLNRKNEQATESNGIITKYRYPVLTAKHTPLYWRYDLNEKTNPFLMERFGINSVFNAGAIYFEGKYLLIARVESVDRKSFFAIAESNNGIDNFRFRKYPVQLPELNKEETNIYDMRLTVHEDGFIYGVFCSEKKDPDADPNDQSAAIAQCGIVRTKNLETWERLPNLTTLSPQQRNAVLHPEFVNGKYAFYTRPQDGFINAGSGGGIGFGTCDTIENAVITNEIMIDDKKYHTISEIKNGQGPAPIKTSYGWLHCAHGVRNTADGLRYVLYLFMTSLADPSKIIHKPGGYLIAPSGEERTGDVSNVLFSNGWIVNEQQEVFIYYGSSDTRLQVATSTINQLTDYVMNTPPDTERSSLTVLELNKLISKNLQIMKEIDLQNVPSYLK